jgi:tetratricopeptide (TPR) repeat protein
VLTSQGKAGEALALLQAAISASPTYAEAHNNLGVLQRDVGAISDALASYERALSLAPDSRNAGERCLGREELSEAAAIAILRRAMLGMTRGCSAFM